MKGRKAEVYILTLLFLLVAVVFGTWEPWEVPAFSFEAMAGGETIQVWAREDGDGFVFLPSYVNLDQLKIQTKKPVYFGDAKMTYGKTCENFSLGTEYPLSGHTKNLKTLTFLRSGNLPALFIDTASSSMEAIHADKTHREEGDLRLYGPDGTLDCRSSLAYIKGRGNSTFLYQQKKPYSLKLRGAKDLLGMGKADKWVLLANAYDDSQLRNKIVYDFAAQAGLGFSPESRFVDLYLNGQYAGLYQLSERNEIHPQRVDIGKEGSFLVSADRSWGSGDPFVYTKSGTSIRIHQSDLEPQQLQKLWQSVENAILAADGLDPVTGKSWTELIDLDSWARKYLMEEVFSNTDGGRYSQFYYRDGAGKIHAGPVWDYDLALSNPATYREFGDVGYRDSRYNMFYVNTNPDAWFYYLYQNPDFQNRVRGIYAQDFLPLLKKLNETVESYVNLTTPAAAMNQVRWNTLDPAAEAAAVQACIAGRTEFLTSVWVENREYVTVLARYVDRNIEYHLLPGEMLTQLPEYPGHDWYYEGTEEKVDREAPVWEAQKVELREKQ